MVNHLTQKTGKTPKTEREKITPKNLSPISSIKDIKESPNIISRHKLFSCVFNNGFEPQRPKQFEDVRGTQALPSSNVRSYFDPAHIKPHWALKIPNVHWKSFKLIPISSQLVTLLPSAAWRGPRPLTTSQPRAVAVPLGIGGLGGAGGGRGVVAHGQGQSCRWWKSGCDREVDKGW